MDKLMTSLFLLISLTAFNVHANATNDGKTSNDGRTSVQTEKNNLPDTRETGNYLKKQSVKNASGDNKPVDLDKSIRTEEAPEDGGMDLES